VEAALQRIWAQCLGVGSIDRNANFFELGGDSLVAISVAMAAANEGLDITPQDLYDNQTPAALAKVLVARYAAGGLARQSPSEVVHPPVPPNIAHFLEHGIREAGRWRIPLVLRLRPDVQIEDIRSVLTAVTNHHDALRLRIIERAGTWEQFVGEPLEFAELATRSLSEGVAPGTPQERDAVFDILKDQIREQDLSSPPLTATYVRGLPGGSCYLALSMHAMVADNASRDILLTDIFTAFGQRLAGEEIALQQVTTPWGEWSQRCAALATRPAVVESRDFWLQTATAAALRVGSEVDEILLAALSRTIAVTIGDGAVAVDLAGSGRSVLKPDVDLRRTVGWFTALYPIALTCANAEGTSIRQLLNDVHHTLSAVPHYGIGYGLLRYLYAPTARLLGAMPPADIFFSYVGAIPELPSLSSDDAPIQFDTDTELPVREAIPGLGHAVELRVYRSGGLLHLDWWYDARRLDHALAESLADGFTTTLMALTRAAITEDEMDSASDELALVDLSSSEV
jgi:phthiocerol/phenolphthiocerol synthesis type-I polyketide synthase E